MREVGGGRGRCLTRCPRAVGISQLLTVCSAVTVAVVPTYTLVPHLHGHKAMQWEICKEKYAFKCCVSTFGYSKRHMNISKCIFRFIIKHIETNKSLTWPFFAQSCPNGLRAPRPDDCWCPTPGHGWPLTPSRSHGCTTLFPLGIRCWKCSKAVVTMTRMLRVQIPSNIPTGKIFLQIKFSQLLSEFKHKKIIGMLFERFRAKLHGNSAVCLIKHSYSLKFGLILSGWGVLSYCIFHLLTMEVTNLNRKIYFIHWNFLSILNKNLS